MAKFGKGDMTPHANGFMQAEKNMPKLGIDGSASYGLHPDTMMPLSGGSSPRVASGKPQSPAQHAAVKKAGAASAARRGARKIGGSFGGML